MPATAEDLVPPPAASSAKWRPNKDEQADLAAIDAVVVRMKDFTPPDPWILTIPQDEPRYHHSSRSQAEAWRAGGMHFDPRTDHESIQNQTFHYYEHGKDMYVLQNSQSVQEPALNGGSVRGRSGTGANTPNGPPKKKISLGEYKKKQTGGTLTPTANGVKGSESAANAGGALKGPIERVRAETEEMLAAVAESEDEAGPVQQGYAAKGQHKDLKRKRTEGAGSQQLTERSSTLNKIGGNESGSLAEKGAEPPSKKARMSTTLHTASEGSEEVHTKQTSQTAATIADDKSGEEAASTPRISPGMPPRLSPGMPQKLSPLREPADIRKGAESVAQEVSALPARLSPTIPDNIARTLAAREHSRASPGSSSLSAPNSATKLKHGKLTPNKQAAGVTKRKSPVPRNGFRASSTSPAIRSDGDNKPQPADRALGEESRGHTPTEDNPPVKATKPTTITHGIRRMLVKLKFKKARREDLRRITRLPSKAKRSMQDADALKQEDASIAVKPATKQAGIAEKSVPIKGVAQKIGPVKKDKKPVLAAKSEVEPQQEDKQLGIEKRASNNNKETTDTPPTKTDEILKARKESKEPSTPAQREVDSPLAPKSALQATPGKRKDLLSVTMRREQSQDSVTTHSTPPDVSTTPNVGSSTSQPNGIVKARSTQPSSKTPKQAAWETERKRLENLGRELKHAASARLSASQPDLSRPTVDQRMAAYMSVESFICYLLAFTCADEAAAAADPRQFPAYKQTWQTLQGYFGFVRKNAKPFPPLYGLVNSLGIVFNSHILELAIQSTPEGGSSRESILDTQAALQKCAAETEANLDIDMLQETFSQSWKARTKNLPPVEKLTHTKLGGPYKLPINVATTPVRAARAGYAMLREWIEREKTDYELKLKL